MICLDTPVLIWGVRGFATRGQEHETVRAERYIKWLKLKNEKVMVPTLVLAEYLVGATATELHHGEIFEMGFQIPPFDIPAARIASDLMRDTDLIKAVAKEEGVGHQCIKTDVMILSVAIRREAEKVVTSDRDFNVFKKLARGRIEVINIPDIPENIEQQQQDLF